MAIASGECLAFRTNVAVGRRIVLELVGQESVRYPQHEQAVAWRGHQFQSMARQVQCLSRARPECSPDWYSLHPGPDGP
jgi:hypothetical protein